MKHTITVLTHGGAEPACSRVLLETESDEVLVRAQAALASVASRVQPGEARAVEALKPGRKSKVLLIQGLDENADGYENFGFRIHGAVGADESNSQFLGGVREFAQFYGLNPGTVTAALARNAGGLEGGGSAKFKGVTVQYLDNYHKHLLESNHD